MTLRGAQRARRAGHRHHPAAGPVALQGGERRGIHRGRRTDADSFAWDVPVAANGETLLKITIAQWW